MGEHPDVEGLLSHLLTILTTSSANYVIGVLGAPACFHLISNISQVLTVHSGSSSGRLPQPLLWLL